MDSSRNQWNWKEKNKSNKSNSRFFGRISKTNTLQSMLIKAERETKTKRQMGDWGGHKVSRSGKKGYHYRH